MSIPGIIIAFCFLLFMGLILWGSEYSPRALEDYANQAWREVVKEDCFREAGEGRFFKHRRTYVCVGRFDGKELWTREFSMERE